MTYFIYSLFYPTNSPKSKHILFNIYHGTNECLAFILEKCNIKIFPHYFCLYQLTDLSINHFSFNVGQMKANANFSHLQIKSN